MNKCDAALICWSYRAINPTVFRRCPNGCHTNVTMRFSGRISWELWHQACTWTDRKARRVTKYVQIKLSSCCFSAQQEICPMQIFIAATLAHTSASFRTPARFIIALHFRPIRSPRQEKKLNYQPPNFPHSALCEKQRDSSMNRRERFIYTNRPLSKLSTTVPFLEIA